MVCKIIFCSEFPDILDKTGRKTRRRRRRTTQAIAKRFAFHANAKTLNLKSIFLVRTKKQTLVKLDFFYWKNSFGCPFELSNFISANFSVSFHAPNLFSQENYNKKVIKGLVVSLNNDIIVCTTLAKNNNHLT